MERLVPEQTLWRSDRWIPRQWTRKSGITFDLLSAVIENRVRRLGRQASRSTRATGRPSSIDPDGEIVPIDAERDVDGPPGAGTDGLDRETARLRRPRG
jgi:hypothetical protein